MIRFLRFIKSDDKIILIDVGANIGYWAETFLSFFPRTRVFAFEPTIGPFKQLKERFAQNANVRVFNIGLLDRHGSVEINIAMESTYSSFHHYKQAVEFVCKEVVMVDMLDNLSVELESPDYVRVMKIDVQGSEIEALRGMDKTLQNIHIILVETSFLPEYARIPPSFPRLSELLSHHGFYPVIFVDAATARGPYPSQRDVFFVREQFLQNAQGW